MRTIDPADLVGGDEVARLFRVGRSTAGQWTTRADRNGFPEPVAELAMGKLWDVGEVVAWYGRYAPLKGGRKPGAAPVLVDGRWAPAPLCPDCGEPLTAAGHRPPA